MPDQTTIFFSLFSSVAGGLAVAITNFLSNREKTKAETKKIEAEAKKQKRKSE